MLLIFFFHSFGCTALHPSKVKLSPHKNRQLASDGGWEGSGGDPIAFDFPKTNFAYKCTVSFSSYSSKEESPLLTLSRRYREELVIFKKDFELFPESSMVRSEETGELVRLIPPSGASFKYKTKWFFQEQEGIPPAAFSLILTERPTDERFARESTLAAQMNLSVSRKTSSREEMTVKTSSAVHYFDSGDWLRAELAMNVSKERKERPQKNSLYRWVFRCRAQKLE